jgi:L-cysteine/cystine lyase
VLDRYSYLNTGSFGPLPRITVAAMQEVEHRELEEGRSGRAYLQRVLDEGELLRAELAGLLGTHPERIALTSSTTEGCNIVLRGLGIGPGDEVVTTDSEHPGLFGGLIASSATLRVAAIRERPTAEILPTIQAQITSRTRLIAISHVSWLDGAVLPVRELAGHGVPVLVDGAQGAGAIPVDVDELGADYYTVSAQKWLLGPAATGASTSPRISSRTAASRSRPTSPGSFPTTSSAPGPFASKARGDHSRRSPGSSLRSRSQQRPETTALHARAWLPSAAVRCSWSMAPT